MVKRLASLILFGFVFQLSLVAQFNLDANANQNLSEVFEQLSNKYDLNIAYPSELIQAISVSTTKQDYTEIDDLIQGLLANTELEYIIQDGKNVLVRKRNNTDLGEAKKSINADIIDLATDTPLSNASVYLDDFSKGTFTDENGRFELLLDPEDLSKDLIISYIGYAELKIPVSQIRANSSFALKVSMNDFEDIIIYHTTPMMNTNLKNTSIRLSDKIIDANQANVLGGGDIFRLVQLLPGISADDDSSSEIKIRGSNADETLIVLDNIPIYKADHYYGVFSNVNCAFVDDVELFKNVIPIDFIGATAGLLRMKSTTESEGTHGTVNANLLSTYFDISTDTNKKVSLNLGGRTTLTNVNNFKLLDMDQGIASLEDLTEDLNEQFIITEPDFRFYDLNSDINFKLGKKSNLKLSNFYSRDKLLDEYTIEYETKKSGKNSKNEESMSFVEEWENIGAALAFDQSFSDKLFLNIITHYSEYNNNSDINTTINISEDGMGSKNSGDNIESTNSLYDLGAKLILENKKNYRFGFSWNRYHTEFDYDDLANEIVNDNLDADQFSVFGSYTFNLNRFTLNLGTRLTAYSSNKAEYVVSPQILGSYKLDEFRNLKFSFGRNHQFVRTIQFETGLGRNVEVFNLANDTKDDIPIGRSLNAMVGYSYKKSDWVFDLELFYKDVDGMLEYTNINPRFRNSNIIGNNYRLYDGKSFARGVDVMLTYNTKSYTSWVAYTLSKIDNQVRQLFNDNPYPNQNDRRHQVKWINQYNFKKWSFTANFFYANGKPYLSYIQTNSNSREELDVDETFDQLPYYGRIDIGLKYSFPLFKNEANISCSIFNLTNRQNVKFIQQTFEIELENRNQNDINVAIGNEASLLNRSIDVGFQLKF